MRIVADTNVIVSAFLRGGTPRRLPDAVEVPILANITGFGATRLSAVAELKSADAAMVPYPPPALRAMNTAALKVFQALRKDRTQKDVLDSMQTRNELYDSLDYHADEQKPDPLFAKDRKKQKSPRTSTPHRQRGRGAGPVGNLRR